MSAPQKFRKKPMVIEAVQFDGRNRGNIERWCETAFWGDVNDGQYGLFVRTLEGNMHVSVGDWIIRGVKGEFYPCKPDIFAATYESVTE